MQGTTILVSSAGGIRITSRILPRPMAPHAVRVLVAIDGEIAVDAAGRRCSGRVVAIRPDREHVATSAGPAACFLFDPESTGARALVDGSADAAVLEGRLRDAALAIVKGNATSMTRPDVLLGVLKELGKALPGTRPRLDRRVLHALELWRTLNGDLPTVDEVSRQVRLSQAHFRDLFTTAIGIPPRRYRTWSLLSRGFRAHGPRNVTELAHQAGFADLAHFARACRTILGVRSVAAQLRELGWPESDAEKHPRFVQARISARPY